MKNKNIIKKESIKNRIKIILEHLAKKEYSDIKSSPLNELLEITYKTNNMKSLNMMLRDVNEWARLELSESQMKTLNAELSEKLNLDVNAEDNIEVKKIQKIIKRGKIHNEDEFRMLHQRVELIYDKDGYASEVESINVLLTDFESVKN